MTSAFDVLPTLTAFDMHAGNSRPVAVPVLPEATTGAIPAARNDAKAVNTAGDVPSQVPGWVVPLPRLRLSAATWYVLASTSTRSIACRMSLKYASPSLENTCMAITDDSGATPVDPAAMPATWVPCVHAGQGAAEPAAVDAVTPPGQTLLPGLPWPE